MAKIVGCSTKYIKDVRDFKVWGDLFYGVLGVSTYPKPSPSSWRFSPIPLSRYYFAKILA
jgi:hypothetical protein